MNLLREIDFFKQLDTAQQEMLSSKAITRSYQAGDILFFAGEKPKSFIFLLDGILKLYKTDPRGNEFILHRFVPVIPIAEMAVLEQQRFPASAAFETDGSVLFIDYTVMQEAIEEDSSLAFALMSSLSRKVKTLEALIEMNIVLDSTARVAKFIVEHAETFNQLKKNLIAQQLNMTPETFSRSLKKLKTMGLVDEPDASLAILNLEGLKALFEG